MLSRYVKSDHHQPAVLLNANATFLKILQKVAILQQSIMLEWML
jgi:hypothetical protein